MHEAVLSSGAAQMTCDLQQIAGNCRRVAEGGHQNQFLAVTHKGDSPRLIVLIESLLTSISYMMLHGYLWTMMDMNQILLDPIGSCWVSCWIVVPVRTGKSYWLSSPLQHHQKCLERRRKTGEEGDLLTSQDSLETKPASWFALSTCLSSHRLLERCV